MFGFLIRPSENINYDFILVVYFLALVIGSLLYVLEIYKVEAIQGAWIVFVPFAPCTLWCFAMRSLQKSKSKVD